MRNHGRATGFVGTTDTKAFTCGCGRPTWAAPTRALSCRRRDRRKSGLAWVALAVPEPPLGTLDRGAELCSSSSLRASSMRREEHTLLVADVLLEAHARAMQLLQIRPTAAARRSST